MDLQYVFVVVATVFAAALHICSAEDMSLSRNAANTKIYCGRQLSDMLSTVCRGNYNTLNKKSDIYQGGGNRRKIRRTSDPSRLLEFPYRSKTSASSIITSFRHRRRRGVFNECCEKACSHEELSSYCGAEPRN